MKFAQNCCCVIFVASIFFNAVSGQVPEWDPAVNLAATVNVDENILVGTVIPFTCSATDTVNPGTSDSTLYYTITDGNKDLKFSLQGDNCTLTVRQALDRESVAKYILTIQVKDLEGNSEPDDLVLTIDVDDIEDQNPVCGPETLFARVDEPGEIGDVIATLTCTDGDSGDAGVLTYAENTPLSSFIKVDTNEAEIQAPFDFESSTSASVQVIVADTGTSPNSVTATVSILVANTDDVQPSLGAIPATDVDENTAFGTSILQINATDSEDATNSLSPGTITYGFEAAPVPDWLYIDPSNGTIYVKGVIDFEVSSTIQVQVYAFSSDDFDNRDTTSFTITVNDENDRAPVFQKPYYVFSVDDNSPANTVVGTVVANDDDTVDNDGDVVYSIMTNSGTLFKIDGTSGEITLDDTADYETNTNHVIEVKATNPDDGDPETTVFVEIVVNPVNENDPSFTGTVTAEDISESTAPGTSLLDATFEDDDDGLDGAIVYSIKEADTAFYIDRETGALSLATSLDFETDSQTITITVVGTDRSTSTPKSAEQQITFTLTDVSFENDNLPSCSQASETLLIQLPQALNTDLTGSSITCTDDDPNTSFSYAITGGNTDSTFKIGTNTLQLASLPTQQEYDLEVTATSQDDDVILNFKVFSELTLSITNLPDTITVEEGNSFNFTVETCCVFQKLDFTIISGNADKIVQISKTSGLITVFLDYDRETTDAFTYTIEVKSTGGQSASGSLSVTVTDANDNSPTFSQSGLTVQLSETYTPSTVTSFTQMLATDLDDGVNSDLTYTIVSGNDEGKFSVDNTGKFYLDSALNYETTSSYTLVVRANDGGATSLSSTATLIVEVTNEDDNNPTVATLPADLSFNVLEDTALGTNVFTLQITDSDTSDVITYSITSGNTGTVWDIDPGTGRIYLIRALNREDTSSYTLVVTGTTQNSQSVTGTLAITITDVNDNSPTFDSNVYEFSVSHDTLQSVSVGDLVPSDLDDGVNSDITLSIISGNAGPAFKLVGNQIQTDTTINYENVQSYVLTVQAVDNAVTGQKTGTTKVIITVDPQTDEPKFTPDSETVDYDENFNENGVGVLIKDFNATALGAVEGDASMTYSIVSGNTDADFAITTDFGLLTLVNTLDYEGTISYPLVIRATAATGGKFDDFAFTVNVNNLNDNSPVFGSDTYEFEVSDTAVTGDNVGTVAATDEDEESFGDLTYAFSGASTAFSINSASGLITVNTNDLDAANEDTYFLVVQATDGGGIVTAVSVVIIIKDENNNAPTFISATATQDVLESVPIGAEIYHFEATDDDTGDSGVITYSITSGNVNTDFALDPTTGILTNLNQLISATTSTYTLTVKASNDAVTPVLQSSVVLTINVVDNSDNKNTPTFAAASSVKNIARTSSIGSTVGTYIATDADGAGDEGTVVHKIQSGNPDGHFLIGESTGIITTATDLTTASDSYELIIIAKDRGTPVKSGTMTLTVNINPAKTTSITPDFSVTIDENNNVDFDVLTITKDPGRTVTGYTIVEGNVGDDFKIIFESSSESGFLRVKGDLDYEDYSLYTLIIDVSSDFDTVSKVVQIQLTDLNDEPPVLTADTTTVTIAEMSPIGSPVLTVTLTDADTLAANRDNILSLASPGTTYFSIDQTGAITVSNPPDFENIGASITFDVVATDNASPFTVDTLSVTVNLIDIDESETVALSSTPGTTMKSFEIEYQALSGQTIHTVTPEDCGFSSSGSATYEYFAFEIVDDPFVIDSSSGEITVSEPIYLKDASQYLYWISCKQTIGSAVEAKLLTLRIDTFDKYEYAVALEFPGSVSEVEEKEEELLERINELLEEPMRAGITRIFGGTDSSRRRLLQSSSTYGLLYIVADDGVDDPGQINSAKTFLTQEQILALLQADNTGIPVNGISDDSVIEVDRIMVIRQEADTSSSDFHTSTWGIVALSMMALLVVVAVIAVVVIVTCFRKDANSSTTKNNDPPEPSESFETLRSVTAGRQTPPASSWMPGDQTSFMYKPKRRGRLNSFYNRNEYRF